MLIYFWYFAIYLAYFCKVQISISWVLLFRHVDWSVLNCVFSFNQTNYFRTISKLHLTIKKLWLLYTIRSLCTIFGKFQVMQKVVVNLPSKVTPNRTCLPVACQISAGGVAGSCANSKQCQQIICFSSVSPPSQQEHIHIYGTEFFLPRLVSLFLAKCSVYLVLYHLFNDIHPK